MVSYNIIRPPSNSLHPRWLLCCGSLLPVFGVKVSVTFHLMCVQIIFSSVSVAKWPSFGKQLLTGLTIFSYSVCLKTELLIV